MKLLNFLMLGLVISVQAYKLSGPSSALSKAENLLSHPDFDTKLRDSEPVSLRKGGGKGSGGAKIGAFGLGIIFIGIALPMVWYNERTQVTIFNLIKRGKAEALPDVPATGVTDTNNFKLVHVTAHTSTQQPCNDDLFGISLSNAMRVVRKVEMYQWVETKVEGDVVNAGDDSYRKNVGDDKVQTTTYRKEWKEGQEDSSCFEHQQYSNPRMPIDSTTINVDANLGDFALTQEMISQLDAPTEYKTSQEEQAIASQAGAEILGNNGYGPLQYEGSYFMTGSIEQGLNASDPKVGDVRMQWFQVPNQQITVVAQQMQDHKGAFTFRDWNPNMVHVPWGEDNDPSTASDCSIMCICCNLMDTYFKTISKEVIDYSRSGQQSLKEAMHKLESECASQTSKYRWISYFLSFFGHILLFFPIINLLAWIPFVGGLLASIFLVAVLVFSFVWATMLHFAIMGTSWIFYRPVFGILLLSGVAAGVALLVLGGSNVPVSTVQ